LAILEDPAEIQAFFCPESIVSIIEIERRILSAAWAGVREVLLEEQAKMTRKTTKSSVLTPRFGPKKC
jgi:hypothetical protein